VAGAEVTCCQSGGGGQLGLELRTAEKLGGAEVRWER
jgi:hypothetical protein